MFRWIVDEDNSIGLEIAFGLFTIIKYKTGSVYSWFKKYPNAPKHYHQEGAV